MKAILQQDGKREYLSNLSFAQSKQATAIMDCIARLIPHEGVDYEVEVIFKGMYDPSVSLNIKAFTDKGERWKSYLTEMIAKYPPVVDYQGDVIPENPGEVGGVKTQENKNEQNDPKESREDENN